jgi:putative pre-16S rRNA nuclease
MRMLGLDVGARRIGVAVSDATGTLASPVRIISGFRSTADAVRLVMQAIEALEAGAEPIDRIVIGLPQHLDGRLHALAASVHELAEALGRAANRPIVFEDERLTSREAESRFAVRERDWRKRKAMLDAAAAAVILQDHLDRQPDGDRTANH